LAQPQDENPPTFFIVLDYQNFRALHMLSPLSSLSSGEGPCFVTAKVRPVPVSPPLAYRQRVLPAWGTLYRSAKPKSVSV
jgi:hypothetical protein